MAAQTGTFVDDARLRARDNSGGPKGPHGISGSDFGDGGKPVAPEPGGGKMSVTSEGSMSIRSRGNTENHEKTEKIGRKGSY